MNIHDERPCVNKDSKRCTMDEKSLDYRLWLFDQATLRQKQRSKDQLERIGQEGKGPFEREILYNRSALSLQRED